MAEKLIKITKGLYIITDGNVKIVEGEISEKNLSKIYETNENIDYIKEIIEQHENSLVNISKRQKKDKKALLAMRLMPLLGYLLLLLLVLPTNSLFTCIGLILPFTILQIAEEWFIRRVFLKKMNIDSETEQIIIKNIADLKQKQKLLEEEQKQNIEKMECKETKYIGETIIKPINHSTDEYCLKISPLTKRLTK